MQLTIGLPSWHAVMCEKAEGEQATCRALLEIFSVCEPVVWNTFADAWTVGHSPCSRLVHRLFICRIQEEEVLNRILFDALAQDKHEFAFLIVDSGIDLGRFLTIGRLRYLYQAVSTWSFTIGFLLVKFVYNFRAPGRNSGL